MGGLKTVGFQLLYFGVPVFCLEEEGEKRSVAPTPMNIALAVLQTLSLLIYYIPPDSLLSISRSHMGGVDTKTHSSRRRVAAHIGSFGDDVEIFVRKRDTIANMMHKIAYKLFKGAPALPNGITGTLVYESDHMENADTQFVKLCMCRDGNRLVRDIFRHDNKTVRVFVVDHNNCTWMLLNSGWIMGD